MNESRRNGRLVGRILPNDQTRYHTRIEGAYYGPAAQERTQLRNGADFGWDGPVQIVVPKIESNFRIEQKTCQQKGQYTVAVANSRPLSLLVDGR